MVVIIGLLLIISSAWFICNSKSFRNVDIISL